MLFGRNKHNIVIEFFSKLLKNKKKNFNSNFQGKNFESGTEVAVNFLF